METLLVIAAIGFLISLVASTLRPPAPPQIIYVQSNPQESGTPGCLPLFVAGVLAVVLLLSLQAIPY
jgi:hypothetical protein